jgi:predicted DNA-binding protein (UPF0251 family)
VTEEDDTWAIAEQVCTPAELEALRLERRGLSQRAIGYALGITREAVRDRLNRAARRIATAIDGQS